MTSRRSATSGLRLPVLQCLGAAALFGASTPACKALLGEAVDPLVLAGLLYLGAGLATLPAARSGGSTARRADPSNLRRLGGAVLFGGVLGPVLLLLGLRTAPSASVSLWLNLETPATALLGWLLFREDLPPRGWVAAGLVVAASTLLAAPDASALAPSAVLVALGCLCWGLDNNLTSIIDGYTPAQTTAVKGLVAGGTNLGLGLFLGGGLPGAGQVVAALAVGALAYGASIVLYIRGAHQLGAIRSQIVFSTAPFLGVALAWAGLGEEVLAVQLAAAGLMVGALVLLFSAEHAHAHVHEPIVHTHGHRHDDGHHAHTHPGLPPEVWHTHEHAHERLEHTHDHVPDLHHRHDHTVTDGT
ncbi:MAG: DMT family transporter [Alphaproteobacteria bacterium]|nr:DMT family transporter [Alphaproteobacteria bacterium]MCB9694743.1 DMT family transporter [Alphaproteobacteria bacterium]